MENKRMEIINYDSARKGVLALILIFLMMVILLVGVRVYAASIQFANNQLKKDVEYLQAEIDSLNGQIIKEVKVSKIEKKAIEEYGMIYPTSENMVYMDDDTDESSNLAATIRGEAYN